MSSLYLLYFYFFLSVLYFYSILYYHYFVFIFYFIIIFILLYFYCILFQFTYLICISFYLFYYYIFYVLFVIIFLFYCIIYICIYIFSPMSQVFPVEAASPSWWFHRIFLVRLWAALRRRWNRCLSTTESVLPSLTAGLLCAVLSLMWQKLYKLFNLNPWN